jgi:membrane associated rhomboid family serine protease
MKTIKTYITNLPVGVKTIIGINLFFYLISSISLFIFSFDVNYYFGFHPTHSGEFKFYQLFTFMFTHSYDPIHITLNLILFLFFSVSFERKFGIKNYILVYITTSLVCVLSFNFLKNYEIEYCKKKLISKNIDVRSITQDDQYQYPKETRILIDRYFDSQTYGVGASGALFGFVGTFMFFNIISLKKIKTILIFCFAGYMIYNNIVIFYPYDYNLSGSAIGHLGGLVTGLILSLYFKIKKGF